MEEQQQQTDSVLYTGKGKGLEGQGRHCYILLRSVCQGEREGGLGGDHHQQQQQHHHHVGTTQTFRG
jgi:hypothetical protein